MKHSFYLGLTGLIIINALFLYTAADIANNTCEEGEALVCFDTYEKGYHIEEGAKISVEVRNEAYGQALVQLWNEAHPDFKGALSYNVGEKTDSDLAYVSLTHALFKRMEYFPLENTEHFALMAKVAREINSVNTLFVPMEGDGFAFITNLDKLEEYNVPLDDLNEDSLVDAVDSFTKIQSVFQDVNTQTDILRLSLNEPYIFYPYFTADAWQLFASNEAYVPGFESDAFLNSLKFIQDLSDFKWNGDSRQEASAYTWDYITAMENNDFIFSMVASWMFVDALEAKIDGNWQITHFPTASEESEILSPFLTNVFGYVLKSDAAYPSAAHEVLRLMRTSAGIEHFMNTDNVIPLAPIDLLNEIQLEDNSQLQFAKALSYGQTESLIAFKNEPTQSAFSLYYEIEIMDVIQALWNGDISPYQAQIEICMRADTWLYNHELKVKNNASN